MSCEQIIQNTLEGLPPQAGCLAIRVSQSVVVCDFCGILCDNAVLVEYSVMMMNDDDEG